MITKKILHIFSLVSIAFLMMACNDNDSFSTSKDNLLSFSTDTLKLDTTFSNVPTSTKTFWVYNRSADGIRLNNVRLENGNQVGFRVNVDGIYLGSTNGYQTSGLEVRKNDSIRVFVELTSPLNNQSKPQLLEDNLIFSLESGVQEKVHLKAYSWDAELVKDLNITSNTTLSYTKPLVIQGNITVAAGATLTIPAGTTVYFSNKAGIDVYGTLKCEGTAANNVVLRGDRLDRMFDYLPYDRVSGQWQGIKLHKGSYGNVLNHTDLHSPYNGIICEADEPATQKLLLSNSTVHNCQGYGLQSVNNDVEIYNCQITNTLYDCVQIVGGKASIIYSTLAQFYPFDSNRGAAIAYANNDGKTDYPLLQLNVQNTLATGYSEDVVSSNLKDGITANYQFSHTLLRTSKTEDATIMAHFTNCLWENTKDFPDGAEKNFVKIDSEKQAYNFHLAKGSKAIGAATPLTDSRYTTDKDGKARSATPSLGCYEYVE